MSTPEDTDNYTWVHISEVRPDFFDDWEKLLADSVLCGAKEEEKGQE